MLVISIGLAVEGYTHGVLGESSSTIPQASPGGPSAAGNRDPWRAGHQRDRCPPGHLLDAARTIALTFDDGPDPAWTPKILAILLRYHVRATFFTVGAHVASYPSLVRQELRDGDEVGSHTYTHLNLTTAGWREPLELTLTQNALAGAAGVRTSLLRPPYCGGPDAVTAADWHAYQQAGRDGYLIVLDSLDTRDWARPGVHRIVATAMPRGGQGAIIMMHDSGGNRNETVRALPQIITRLRARGYRFTTVTGGLHLPSADVAATRAQRLAGLALVLTQQAADHAVAVLAVMLVIASVLIAARILLLLGFARAHRRRAARAAVPPPDLPSRLVSPWSSPPTTRQPGSPRP